jgi:hypothetical protein
MNTKVMLFAAVLCIACQEETPQQKAARELHAALKGAGLGNSTAGNAIAFDCDSDVKDGPCIDVHIVSPTEDRVARGCDCEAIQAVLQTLTACCNGTPGSARTTCKNGTSWGVDCRGQANNPFALRGQGPTTPEIGISWPAGFTRNIWPCTVNGARNPDIVMMEQVHASCCLN